MNSTTFKAYLISNLSVETDEDLPILDQYKVKKIQKGDHLLRQSNFCTHTFFVEKGLLRQYALDEKGREHMMMFAPENWFVSDRESIFFKRPSVYNIQALEDTQVAMLDKAYFQQLNEQLPHFTEFNNRLLHNHIRHLQKRIHLLLSTTAEERYLQFVEMYPDILLRVPQTMVASYLGITPESLSRVRRELARKNFKP